jgi:hypothetical protein
MAVFSAWGGNQLVLKKSDTPLAEVLFVLSFIFIIVAFRE